MSKVVGQIGKSILVTLGVVGIVVVAITAPNLFKVFGAFGPTNRQYKRSIKTLKKRKLISVKKYKNSFHIKLTKAGEKQLTYEKLYDLRLEKRLPWDKKWRVVIFDVPVAYNAARDELTWILKELGFKILQKSAWICPWPCYAEVNYISEGLGIGSFVKVLLAEEVPDAEHFKRQFKVT